MNGLLWLCFALSGAAALALEILWMRSAGFVLGTTAATTATILACYFTGLGLGSACARQGSPRPVRRYGCLELGAGVGALWSLAVFWLLTHDAVLSWLGTVGLAGRVVAVAVAILPTTLCLGATLPALGQALASVETVGTAAVSCTPLTRSAVCLGLQLQVLDCRPWSACGQAMASPLVPACSLDSWLLQSEISTRRQMPQSRKEKS